MRYTHPRSIIQWTRHPYLEAAKVCAIVLHEDGLRGKNLGAAVRRIFPAIDIVAGKPVSENTIAQRGDKGVRYGREHYLASPWTAEIAKRVRLHIALDKPWRRVIRR